MLVVVVVVVVASVVAIADKGFLAMKKINVQGNQ